MQILIILSIFFGGILVGLAIAYILRVFNTKSAERLAEELYLKTEEARRSNVETVVENVKSTFRELTMDALSRSSEEFLKLAKTKLETEREVSCREFDSKKGLIDQQLGKMQQELDKVGRLMKDLETDRVKKFGELSSSLRQINDQTASLRETTDSLRQALSSTKVRGQWGERMAEDVLHLAGFIENINYSKQKTLEAGTRPDFTFFMPRELKLNMDVKFPLDNYLRHLDAEAERDRAKFRDDFLRDVKNKIREVTTRDYINPEENTVDYVLLFIPNDQIYAFIHEQDRTVLDEALRNKVILCSPITLFAVLAVIRQAVDNFSLEQTSNEILSLFGSFKKQWHLFISKFDSLGTKIDAVQNEYDALTTTRRRKLEKPLNKIEDLRSEKAIPIIYDETPEDDEQ
ncbi:MAG: recombinase RmuC [Spirochaetes bacterium RBG_16_49_21]|nr:MAG: recombinase RmuC [Spirochaetes bacterium RBG_16_49_21]